MVKVGGHVVVTTTGGASHQSGRGIGGFFRSVRDAGSRTPHTRMNLQERLARTPSGEPRTAVRRNALVGEGTRAELQEGVRVVEDDEKFMKAAPSSKSHSSGAADDGQSSRTPAGDGGRSKRKRERPTTLYASAETTRPRQRGGCGKQTLENRRIIADGGHRRHASAAWDSEPDPGNQISVGDISIDLPGVNQRAPSALC